jgi:hypothetical protein
MTKVPRKALLFAIFVTVGLLLMIITFFGLFGIGPLTDGPVGIATTVLGLFFIVAGVAYLFYRSPNDFEIAINPEYKSSSSEEPGIQPQNIPPSETIYDELGGMEGRVVRRGKF